VKPSARAIRYDLRALDQWCAARTRLTTSDPGPNGQ